MGYSPYTELNAAAIHNINHELWHLFSNIAPYLYYGEDELFDIYTIMQRGFSEKSIGNVVSFLVSIYIYMNSTLNNATNAISLYMFGMRKLKPSMVDDIIKFLKEEFNNSLNDEKNKQKVKKVVDK